MNPEQTGYYTIEIPPVPATCRQYATPYHAKDETITRGCFFGEDAEFNAYDWARSRLGGWSYSVRWIPGIEDMMPESDNVVAV